MRQIHCFCGKTHRWQRWPPQESYKLHKRLHEVDDLKKAECSETSEKSTVFR